MTATTALFGTCQAATCDAPGTHKVKATRVGGGNPPTPTFVVWCCRHAHPGVECSAVANATCGHRWDAPRVEVPTSVLVQHVCDLPHSHEEQCHCSCGALDDDTWFD